MFIGLIFLFLSDLWDLALVANTELARIDGRRPSVCDSRRVPAPLLVEPLGGDVRVELTHSFLVGLGHMFYLYLLYRLSQSKQVSVRYASFRICFATAYLELFLEPLRQAVPVGRANV